MRNLCRLALVLSLAAVMAAPLMAQDKKKKKRKKRSRGARVVALRLPKAVQQSLTDEQKKKITAIRKEFAPKYQEFAKKQREIVPVEKLRAARKAVQEARKASASMPIRKSSWPN